VLERAWMGACVPKYTYSFYIKQYTNDFRVTPYYTRMYQKIL